MRRLTAALLALAGLLLWPGWAAAVPSLFSVREPWVDEHGKLVQLERFRGQPVLVAMEYSACRFVCSAYWLRLQHLQQEADRRGLDLQFVILSIDPDNDNPASWRDYRQARALRRSNWHFLTASKPVTARVAGLLGVRWWYADGHLMHDFKIVRLAGDGSVDASMTRYDEPADLLLSRP
jgi:protein SCO1/2